MIDITGLKIPKKLRKIKNFSDEKATRRILRFLREDEKSISIYTNVITNEYYSLYEYIVFHTEPKRYNDIYHSNINQYKFTFYKKDCRTTAKLSLLEAHEKTPFNAFWRVIYDEFDQYQNLTKIRGYCG